jgi:hypothetical protein
MNLNQIGKRKNYITLIFPILILIGCAQNPTLESSMGECSSSVKTIQSFGDTIRLEYDFKYEADANRIASKYCAAQEKFVEKNTTNCKGCCVSTYICKIK